MERTRVSKAPADETERLSRELRRSEARFRDVIERNADAIVVVDADGRICFANAMAGRLFGQSCDTLLKHPFGFPVVTGETTELDLLRNGSTVVVEMRVVESEWEGEPAFIATLRDATDRKRAEQNERKLIREQAARTVADQAAARFRFLADASAALAGSLDYRGMLSLLPELCVKEIADWAIVYRVEDGALHRVDAAHRESQREAMVQRLRQYPSPPRALTPVVEAVRTREALLISDVSPSWLDDYVEDPNQRALLDAVGLASLMIVPLIARGNVLGALTLASMSPDRRFTEADLALAKDLATRAALALDNARLYHEAREANQTKTDFLAVISHDLRTPLNAILGYAELLIMGIPEQLSEGSTQSVDRIRTAASHLVYLIDQLLAYARLESRHEEVHRDSASMNEIAEQVNAVMQPLAAERGLQFILELPDHPIMIETDANKLRQILLNLASNAVKYSNDGEVRLGAVEREEHVFITVADSGVGIGEDDLQRIFEPFWQASSAQRGPSTGTGLGLSVVKQLVELLGGDISVRSALGQGTTFTVTLPCRPGATTLIETTADSAADTHKIRARNSA